MKILIKPLTKGLAILLWPYDCLIAQQKKKKSLSYLVMAQVLVGGSDNIKKKLSTLDRFAEVYALVFFPDESLLQPLHP